MRCYCRRCTHQLIRPQTGSKRFRWVHRISQAGLISHWQLHVAEITPLNSHGHCMIMAPRLPLRDTSHPFNTKSSHDLPLHTQAPFLFLIFCLSKLSFTLSVITLTLIHLTHQSPHRWHFHTLTLSSLTAGFPLGNMSRATQFETLSY